MSKCNMDCFNCIYDDCIEGGGRRSGKSKARSAERKSKRYAAARAQGLCGACFKVKATRGVFCEKCYKRERQRYATTDIRKRRQRWEMREDVASFIDNLIARGYAAGSVYNYRHSVEKFFSLFGEVTVENAGMYREMLKGCYYRTANNRISAFNKYCEFIGKPECKIERV